MNLSAYRKVVRGKFPQAYIYKWAPRQWCVYAAKDGAFTGFDLSGCQKSEAAAWINAARSPSVTGAKRK